MHLLQSEVSKVADEANVEHVHFMVLKVLGGQEFKRQCVFSNKKCKVFSGFLSMFSHFERWLSKDSHKSRWMIHYMGIQEAVLEETQSFSPTGLRFLLPVLMSVGAEGRMSNLTIAP